MVRPCCAALLVIVTACHTIADVSDLQFTDRNSDGGGGDILGGGNASNSGAGETSGGGAPTAGGDGGAGGMAVAGGGGDGGDGDGGDGGGNTANKRVFVTSAMFPGDLDGVAPDTHCETAAESAALGGGGWVAFIADGDHPQNRMACVAPWHLLDSFNTPVFPDCAQLSSAQLTVGIHTDEHGQSHTGDFVWTGLEDAITTSVQTCAGWSSASAFGASGIINLDGSNWAHVIDRGCSNSARLYCFEQ